MVSVRFRRQLLPFQKFSVTSFVAGWDARSFYIETRLITFKGTKAFINAVIYSRLTLPKGQDPSFSPRYFLQQLVDESSQDGRVKALPPTRMSSVLARLAAMEESSSQALLAATE